MKSTLHITIATALIIGVWQALVTFCELPHYILPSPAKVTATLWQMKAIIANHAVITTTEVLLGLLIGTIMGVLTAILLSISPLMRYLLKPILVLTQALPVFAMAPLFTLWLGYGMQSKVLVAVLIIYFPVTSAFFDGLMQTPKGWLDLAQVMGATPMQSLLRIRIPAALPSFASGLRLAAVYAPIGAVIGEWVGASQGLGYLMLLANGRAKIDLMFAALLVLIVITLLLHTLVGRFCDLLVNKYKP